ncbi:MAG TPA: hypothetical protein VIS99_10375 [Terrimicrobiaceae bacterium]
MILLRYAFLLFCSIILFACAHREKPFFSDGVSFDQRLHGFESLHNTAKTEELRPYFTKNATIQSPITPRPASVEKYLTALKAEPYHLGFARTEVIYSFARRAATRSDAVAGAVGRFNLKERVAVDWQVEDGYWRISRIVFSNWSPIVGTWRRAGQKREGSIELRVLPDGNYLVYLGGDYTAPQFRGRYRLEANKIVFEDTSSSDPAQLQRGEGSYLFVRAAAGIDLRKIQDENPWRSERYEGVWSSSH